MAEFYPYMLAATAVAVIALAACGLGFGFGYWRGNAEGYDRGFIAARLKFEIPRGTGGKFVKRQP